MGGNIADVVMDWNLNDTLDWWLLSMAWDE
jgi:hypothetical protein